MATEIFKSYKEFKRRPDKSVNGVDAKFAAAFPEYESHNDTNHGCWNCVECRNCTDCINCCNCRDCKSCKDSIDCSDCENCQVCDNCSMCHSCKQSESCVNCTNCIGCTELADGEGQCQLVTTSI